MASKHKSEHGLAELKSFIDSVKLDARALSKPSTETKGVYKKFYSLLIFDYILQENILAAIEKAYAKEAVSDMSHGFFLSCVGIYKPARTSVRSAIENFIRFLVLHRGVDALSIRSVFDLFDQANSQFKSEPRQKTRIGKLRGVYKELCKTVHSSSADYMNLEVPFGTMLRFDQEKYQSNIDVVRECCSVFGEILFVEFHDLILKSHHTHRDHISDGVAKSVRQEAVEKMQHD